MKSPILKSFLITILIAAFAAAFGGCYFLGPFDAINGEGFYDHSRVDKGTSS